MKIPRPHEEVTNDGDGPAAGSMLLMQCNADVVHDNVHGAGLGTITRPADTSPKPHTLPPHPIDRHHRRGITSELRWCPACHRLAQGF